MRWLQPIRGEIETNIGNEHWWVPQSQPDGGGWPGGGTRQEQGPVVQPPLSGTISTLSGTLSTLSFTTSFLSGTPSSLSGVPILTSHQSEILYSSIFLSIWRPAV